jgi:hypothetical protein
MSALSWLRLVEKRYPWGIVGVALAILFGLVGVYSFVHDKRPELVYEIESQSNVFDVHAPPPTLSVMFQGEDIEKRNLNLRIVRLRVINRGEADLLQTYFDAAESWGVAVHNGQLVEIRWVEDNSPYLRRSVVPRLASDSLAVFSKVIVDRGKFFTVDLLILHDKRVSPALVPAGKIAGSENIEIFTRPNDGTSESVWRQLLRGSIWLHLLRVVVYSALGLLLLVIGAIVAALIGSGLEATAKRRRRTEISELMVDSDAELRIKEFVIGLYADYDISGLRTADELLKDQALLDSELRLDSDSWSKRFAAMRVRRTVEAHDAVMGEVALPADIELAKGPGSVFFRHEVIQRLKSAELVIARDGKMTVGPPVMSLLSQARDRLIARHLAADSTPSADPA